MLKIEFEAEHDRYLVGWTNAGKFIFNRVSDNPKAGRHLSTHQVFSNNGLLLAIYLRNDVDLAGDAVKVYAGLKLLFTHKVHGDYLLHNDKSRINLSLDLGGAKALYGWLKGWTQELKYELPRAGAAPRQLSGFDAGSQFILTLRATEYRETGNRMIDVGLSDEDIFHLELYCLALGRLHYPSFSDAAVSDAMKPRAATRQASVNTSRDSQSEAPHELQPSSEGSYATEPASAPANARPLDIHNCRTAIYAVGMKRWPRRDLATIKRIQEQTVEIMDRLVKAGNAGDFTEWDRIYELQT